jgi:hypothetical protein
MTGQPSVTVRPAIPAPLAGTGTPLDVVPVVVVVPAVVVGEAGTAPVGAGGGVPPGPALVTTLVGAEPGVEVFVVVAHAARPNNSAAATSRLTMTL